MSAPATTSNVPAGTQVGGFEVLRPLGKGGMGAVYVAKDLKLGREVALKLLSPQLFEIPGYHDRFLREAQAAARLSHPNIVAIYTFGDEGGMPFFAMELVPGRTLDELVRQHGALPARDAAQLVLQAVSGLGHAFDKAGVVHRDIKPGNLILGDDGRVRILDFGLARAEDSTSLTAAGAVMGTPDYMSPEQVRGDDTDLRTDIYSLGVVLYQLLSGELPFPGKSAGDVMVKQVSSPPPPLAPRAPGAPASMVAIVERCLQKAPDQRFQDYITLEAALRRAFQEAPHKTVLGHAAPGVLVDRTAPTAVGGASVPPPLPGGAAVAPVGGALQAQGLSAPGGALAPFPPEAHFPAQHLPEFLAAPAGAFARIAARPRVPVGESIWSLTLFFALGWVLAILWWLPSFDVGAMLSATAYLAWYWLSYGVVATGLVAGVATFLSYLRGGRLGFMSCFAMAAWCQAPWVLGGLSSTLAICGWVALDCVLLHFVWQGPAALGAAARPPQPGAATQVSESLPPQVGAATQVSGGPGAGEPDSSKTAATVPPTAGGPGDLGTS